MTGEVRTFGPGAAGTVAAAYVVTAEDVAFNGSTTFDDGHRRMLFAAGAVLTIGDACLFGMKGAWPEELLATDVYPPSAHAV